LRGLNLLFLVSTVVAGQQFSTNCRQISFPFQAFMKIEFGQIHCYRVVLDSRQLVRASLYQHGVDLWASVRPPGGEEEIFDTRWHGEERFAVGSGASGMYVIRVGITADSPWPGEYNIEFEIEDGPNAHEADATRARVLFTRAKGRLRNPDRTQLALAASEAEEALALWRSAGEPLGEAQALNALGYLRNLAGDREAAIRFYDQALAIWVRLGDLTGQGETRQNLAMSLNGLGRRPEALEQSALALQFRREAGDRLGEVYTLLNLATIEFQSGRFERVIELCMSALARLEGARANSLEIAVCNNLAVAYQATERYRDALAIYHRALPISRVLDRRGYGYLLSNIAYLQDQLGQPTQALQNLRQARNEAQRTGDPVLEAATLINIANIHLGRGEISEAARANDESLSMPALASNPGIQVKVLLTRARILERRGDSQTAERIARESLDRGTALGDPSVKAAALVILGQIATDNKDYEQSIAFNNEALLLWREAENHNSQALTLVALGKAKRVAGQNEEALRDIVAAVDLLESTRMNVSAQDLRASLLASRYEYFKLWIELLVDTGQPAEALAAAERARSRVLLDLLREERTRIRAGDDPELVVEINRLTADINGRAYVLSRLPPGKESAVKRSSVGKELNDLLTRRRELEDELRGKSPRYNSLTGPTLKSAEIQSLLDSQTALIEYSLGLNRSFAWVVTKAAIRIFELPGQAVIEKAVQSLHRSVLDVNADATPSARKVSELLIAPIALPAGIRRLAIVADGPLEGVPFAALPGADGRPMLTTFEIVRLPSASVLAAVRQQWAGRRPAPLGAFVVADPVFDNTDPRVPRVAKNVSLDRISPSPSAKVSDGSRNGFPRLYFSGEEARAIASEFGPNEAKLYEGFNARRDVLLTPETRRYRIHHLATHLVLDSQRPELSRIVFSLVNASGRPIDGYFRLYEIYNLDLPSELVVLSACESGLGAAVNGEGLIGFTRGMMLAGARAVLVSLWPINDEATAELMKRFYRELISDRLPPAAALQRAQLAMMGEPRWRKPYFWAGFSLHGDWLQR
jgi:CHAT domain-containing protein